MVNNFKQILGLFGLREVEGALYEKLLTGGEFSATDLARQTNVSRTSVYDYLARLKDEGLVYQTMERGMKVFGAQPFEKVMLLLEEREKDLREAKQVVTVLRQELKRERQFPRPRLQVFEGREALQQMMKDMLLYRDITVHAYWPVVKTVEVLTPAFLERFHRERIERNITIKVIWPSDQVSALKKYPFLRVGHNQKREVCLAPPDVRFSLGYAIYGTTVRFISSLKESYGFLIESRELAETMRGQFEVIWRGAKPFTPET